MPGLTYVLEAELLDHPGVARTLRMPGERTLVDLHELLREAFEWHDDHLYSFWLSGRFWNGEETERTSPVEAEPGAKTADIPLDSLGLEQGQEVAYLFDFGDEWRVRLTVKEIRQVREDEQVGIVATVGAAPPQYGAPPGEGLGEIIDD